MSNCSGISIANKRPATRPRWIWRASSSSRCLPPTAFVTPPLRSAKFLTSLPASGKSAGWRLPGGCCVRTPQQMAQIFADLPEAIANTLELSSRLEFSLEKLGYEFPRYPVPDGGSQNEFLRAQTMQGARERYRPLSERARRQLEKELNLIEKLDLAGYFLIVWDMIRFCREQGILVQGRGSAANSAVCYALGITAVDPVGMDLL